MVLMGAVGASFSMYTSTKIYASLAMHIHQARFGDGIRFFMSIDSFSFLFLFLSCLK